MKANYKVLFVDDDRRYAEPLIERAFSEYNIELDYHENWEEALSCLADDNSGSYQGVIIDGKGKKTKDSKGDDVSHVVLALRDLSERKGKGKFLPYVVLSKYLEIKDLVEMDIFFEKGKDEDEMFKYFIKRIANLESEKIKAKYSEPFEIIGQYFSKDVNLNLLEVLIDFESNTWTKNSFTPLRKIIEAIYIGLHEYDDRLIPHECLRFNGQVNLKYCELRVTGKDIIDQVTGKIKFQRIPPILPENLQLLINPLTKICNKASHNDTGKNLTKYALGTVIFGVLDLLLWYSQFVIRK